MNRTIVLVPGLVQGEQGAAKARLREAIEHYAQRYVVVATPPIREGEPNQEEVLRVTPRSGSEADEQTVRIHEMYWGDLAPSWADETPWRRFVRGTHLVGYWLVFGPASLKAQGSRTTRAFMILAAFLLLVWYASVAVVMVEAVASTYAGSALPGWLADGLSLVGVTSDALMQCYEALKSAVPFTLFGGLFLLRPIDGMAKLSAFVRMYLRDEGGSGDGPGIRAKARRRVVDLLDKLLKDPAGPDEIVIIGHSLGGAIAVDALAEVGQALPRIALHTWGSSLSLLAGTERQVLDEIRTLQLAKPGLAAWVDVVETSDFLGSRVPEVADATAGSRIVRLDVTRPVGNWTDVTEAHNYYFRSQTAIEALLEPFEHPGGESGTVRPG